MTRQEQIAAIIDRAAFDDRPRRFVTPLEKRRRIALAKAAKIIALMEPKP